MAIQGDQVSYNSCILQLSVSVAMLRREGTAKAEREYEGAHTVGRRYS
jgi:hypothetical protein